MDEIIKAAGLYKAVLKENKAEFLIPLEECKIVFIPNMPFAHRSIWTEEVLIIFYSNYLQYDEADYLVASNSIDGKRRGCFAQRLDDISDENIKCYITNMYCCNLQLEYDETKCPHYIEIEPDIFLRTINLLAFI